MYTGTQIAGRGNVTDSCMMTVEYPEPAIVHEVAGQTSVSRRAHLNHTWLCEPAIQCPDTEALQLVLQNPTPTVPYKNESHKWDS